MHDYPYFFALSLLKKETGDLLAAIEGTMDACHNIWSLKSLSGCWID
jgi:hypothetical protein